jgi:hypothetical protein
MVVVTEHALRQEGGHHSAANPAFLSTAQAGRRQPVGLLWAGYQAYKDRKSHLNTSFCANDKSALSEEGSLQAAGVLRRSARPAVNAVRS